MKIEQGGKRNRWSADQRSKIVALKAQRLQRGKKPRCLDLFSGCGGLSLGFRRANFKILGGVELDSCASESYAVNFHGLVDGEAHPLHARSRDINETRPLELLRELRHEEPESAVDVIIGGPPCPSFARVGRAKLRQIAGHPDAFLLDPRSDLYRRYLDYVEQLAPVALVMENVPDMLNHAGRNLGEEISARLRALGYTAHYTLLNAARYGVPQMRERLYLVAIHDRLGTSFEFPSPTHSIKLPTGYSGTIAHALAVVGKTFVRPPAERQGLPLAVTAEEAIGDLPRIEEHLRGELRRGARRFDTPIQRRVKFQSGSYAESMYCWPGFEGSEILLDHVIRSLSTRDFPLFEGMKCGDDYPKAYELADRLFKGELERRGLCWDPDNVELQRLRKKFVPPYDPRKFPNKWRKIEPHLPARTLMAHLGKDSYSHIHYDSTQARTISVREAARLQSFPDGFVFRGAMNAAFRQIGNSVPPLMAFALAGALRRALSRKSARHRSSDVRQHAASRG